MDGVWRNRHTHPDGSLHCCKQGKAIQHSAAQPSAGTPLELLSGGRLSNMRLRLCCLGGTEREARRLPSAGEAVVALTCKPLIPPPACH